ncbi:hypothetical protein [Liberibacter crescens]|uniref:hypothetical protein n=1 Tax=Liberibacter crescens TaxID=1273132 RepID=UPI00059F2929|nr:hypothetical protein [Liberibacter crescens]AMC12684.1 hypothetical protein RL73_02820 [Liberibacter crescens]
MSPEVIAQYCSRKKDAVNNSEHATQERLKEGKKTEHQKVSQERIINNCGPSIGIQEEIAKTNRDKKESNCHCVYK